MGKHVWRYHLPPYDDEMYDLAETEYFQGPEDKIEFSDLPDYWEYHKVQFTDKWRTAFNQRLCNDYNELYSENCPDMVPADVELPGYDQDNWERVRDGFFDSVQSLEVFDFKGAKWQRKPVTFDSPLNSTFTEAVPEYQEYVGMSEAYEEPTRQDVWRATPVSELLMDIDVSRDVSAESAAQICGKDLESQPEAEDKSVERDTEQTRLYGSPSRRSLNYGPDFTNGADESQYGG